MGPDYYLFEILFNVGALDVFTQSVMMKKSRPGILLTVICDLEKIDLCEEIIFRETTTIGIRRQIQQRSILERKIETVNTKYGDIRVKIAHRKGQVINIQPEYEDCLRLAREFNLPFQTIFLTALVDTTSNNSA